MRFFTLALVLLVFLIGPSRAYAQCCTYTIELDWRIHFGQGSYGIAQVVESPGNARTTTLCWGTSRLETEIPAIVVVMSVLAVPASAVAASIMAFSFFSRRKKIVPAEEDHPARLKDV